MKLKKVEKIDYLLTLTEKEALWLRAVMQNPILNYPPDAESFSTTSVQESPEDQEMREGFFNLLSSRIDKYKEFSHAR